MCRYFRNLGVRFVLMVAILFSSRAWADGDLLPSEYYSISNRYIYANPGDSIPAHWKVRIFPRFSDDFGELVKKQLMTDFLKFSDAVGADVDLTNFPSGIFSNEPPDGEVNFSVFALPDAEFKGLVQGGLPPTGSATGGQVDGVIEKITRDPLEVIHPGCALGWEILESGEYTGFVLAVSEGIPVEKQVDCVRDALPRGFGIYPIVTRYNIPIKSLETGDVYNISLLDRSEPLLELIALNTCKTQLPKLDRSCTSYLIDRVLEYRAREVQKNGD